MAVWPCLPPGDPTGPAGPLPPLLAHRLITTYTQLGQTVLAAGAGASVIAETAVTAGRPVVLDHAHPPRVFPPLGPTRATLIIATPPAATRNPATYTRWARALARPARGAQPCPDQPHSGPGGGVLAVVLLPGYGLDALFPGRVICAATAAGLDYIQHVIAVTAALHDDRLHPAPSAEDLARARAARHAGLPVHLGVHLDVLILRNPAARPAAGHPRPAPTAPGPHGSGTAVAGSDTSDQEGVGSGVRAA